MTEVHSSAPRTSREDVSQAIHDRIMRGLEHYTKHAASIESVGGSATVYRIPSNSREGRTYTVRLDVVATNGERIDVCECEDYVIEGHKHGLCRHTVCAMVFWAKGGSLEHARRYASYWIEYRTNIRSPEAYCPRDGYVMCEAFRGSGRRYITETLPNGNYCHYRDDRFRDLGEGATLIGTYRNSHERAEAIRRLRLGGEGVAA